MKERKEAVEMIFNISLFMSDSWRYSKKYAKPGSVVLNMSPERRKVLQALKSEDLRNLRPDLIFV